MNILVHFRVTFCPCMGIIWCKQRCVNPLYLKLKYYTLNMQSTQRFHHLNFLSVSEACSRFYIFPIFCLSFLENSSCKAWKDVLLIEFSQEILQWLITHKSADFLLKSILYLSFRFCILFQKFVLTYPL